MATIRLPVEVTGRFSQQKVMSCEGVRNALRKKVADG